RHEPRIGGCAGAGGRGAPTRSPPALVLSQSAHDERQPADEGAAMQVREGMSEVVLTVGPDHTLRDAARFMARRGVGAAVVLDPEQPGPGIITGRDVLLALAEGQDPDG